mmetsp:Transcript_6945/g.7942  ORF Transcript_6945/g.7942 Transcript_6945/m.7942 type:complete len:613 (-) Transcript_6945:24-1862(-)
MNPKRKSPLLFVLLSCSWIASPSYGFQFQIVKNTITAKHRQYISSSSSSSSALYNVYNDDEEKEQIEESRINVYKSRRGEIRSMLKSSESLRNFRNKNGYVSELDEEGNPINDDGGKTAVAATAFAVTFGAIILRVGGRAALVSAVGLDFVNDNPAMQNNINQVLEYAETMDPILKSGLFFFGWTLTKTFCFDAAGIVLAFSSGILFGGVLQGAVMSAIGATIGSSVAFALAKADTPIRKKALEVVEENPSLRGLEKVVSDEGLKAVLTLRLAPVLPIPLGMYNYVYGISNVRYFDFAGGIFLGSLKPYFLDSYLGYFGKSVLDGSAAAQQAQGGGGATLQDYALIGVLGVSVLIGVFASQLASETWDVILKEQEEEEKKLQAENGNSNDDTDGVTKELFGWELPQWIMGFQYGLQDADERIEALVMQEYDANVWNYTDDKSFFGIEISKGNSLPDNLNPALVDPRSPEITGRYKGFDYGAATCDGLVLSPILFSYFLKFSDPLFDEKLFEEERTQRRGDGDYKNAVDDDNGPLTSSLTSVTLSKTDGSFVEGDDRKSDISSDSDDTTSYNYTSSSIEFKKEIFRNELKALKDEMKQRLNDIDKKIDRLNEK